MLSKDRKREISNKINEKLSANNISIRCPMCRNDKFVLADSYIRTDLQDDMTVTSFGGPSIPTIAIICNNCGFMSLHSLGILGLLPDGNGAEDD